MTGQGRRVVVLGQGYVGLPVAMRAVEVGFDVVGFDVDDARVTRLAAGESFIDDVSDDDLGGALATGRYRPSADVAALAAFDVAVISVPTPLTEGVPDLSAIERACELLAPHVREGCVVVLESTTYPGTTEELVVPLLERGSGRRAGRDFAVGYSPERIDPGNPTYGFANTPKVVSGVDEASTAAVADFYRHLVEQVVVVPGTREAELAKLLENTFRHVNIALVNELAIYAHRLGIDIWASIDAAATKPFGFLKFTPGPGVGGHCLPIDPSYLSWKVQRSLGHNFRFIELANDVNQHMPDYVVSRVVERLNDDAKAVRGARVLALGIAYKRNSGDARESPAVEVVERLVRLGARVRVVDDWVEVMPHGFARGSVSAAELSATDLVVVLTDHDDVDYGLVAASGVPVLDTRHRMAGAHVQHL